MSSLGLPFDFKISFSHRRRTVQLAVIRGEVNVRAPIGISSDYVHSLLWEKQAWILEHVKSYQLNSMPAWSSREDILFAGDVLPFSWRVASKASVVLDQHAMVVSVPNRVLESRREHYLAGQIQRYFSDIASHFFQNKVVVFAERMQLQPTAVRIGNWRRRWGCCDSKGVIGFNWRLVQAPVWVAEYVVVHELAHLRYMNHSVAFWQLVEWYSPDYKQAQLWLKRNQHRLL